MNVNLTPELERLVKEKVKSGMYGSASEVVREALRLMARTGQSGPDRVAEEAPVDYAVSRGARLRRKMERIWADQERKGHVPPSKEEVDAYIRKMREGWDR